MIKVYTYAKCSTCVKAIKYLENQKLKFEEVPIVEKPPSKAELKLMLGFLKVRQGTFKNLFNTSGEQYRALKIADQIKAGMTETQAIELLSTNGKLIKRPFLLVGPSSQAKNGAAGFQSELWAEIL